MNININQFAQVPIRGQLDLQITKSGVISGVISANQMSSLKAGDAVKLDATVTVGNLPQFVAAAVGDVAIGYLASSVKQDTFVALDACEVVGLYGPVMWLSADVTILAGAVVDQKANGNMEPHGTTPGSTARAIALDPGVAGQLSRFILTAPMTPQ